MRHLQNSGSRFALKRAVIAAVEPLEVRQLMSTVVGGDIDGDGVFDIKVTGTSGTDRITIYMDPLHNFAAVHDDKNGNGVIDSHELSYGSQFETIDVSTLGGNDTVNVRLLSDLAGGLLQNAAPISIPVTKGGVKGLPAEEYYGQGISVYVDLGSGNDKFEFSSPTSLSSSIATKLSDAALFDVNADPDGADIVEGGDLVLQVDGGNDKDTINFDFSRTSVVCSSLIVTSDAGSGDDTVNVTLPDFQGNGLGGPLEAQEGIVGCFTSEPDTGLVSTGRLFDDPSLNRSDVSIAVDLGSGKNTLNINARTLISASDAHIEVDGGKDTDIINDHEEIVATGSVVTLLTPIDLVTSKEVDLVGGNATYVVDVELGSGDDSYFQTVQFDNNLDRTQRALDVEFNGAVTYNVRGDSGKDTIKVKDADNGLTPNENTAFIEGKLTYNLYGGNDDDNVQFDTNPGSQFAMSGGTLNVLVSCDGGNDFGRIDLALVPNSLMTTAAGAIADPAILTLSGGSGNDKLGMMVEVVQQAFLTAGTKGPSLLLPPGFFGPRGYPLLDGGSGSDKYDTEGNVTIVTRGAETFDDSIEPDYIP